MRVAGGEGTAGAGDGRDDVPAAGTAAAWPDAAWRLGYRVAHGLLRVWWRLRRPDARGVGVAVWHGGRLLVVRTSYRNRHLTLPGGGVGRGEEPRAAALRELREEVRIAAPAADDADGPRQVALLRFVLDHRPIEDAIFEWRPATRPAARPDGREVVWAGWLAPAELAAAPLLPGLRGYLAGEGRPVAGNDGSAATGGSPPGEVSPARPAPARSRGRSP